MRPPLSSSEDAAWGRRAFSLVELLVVILILGLIGGTVAISATTMLPNQRFNSAVRTLSDVLHTTRADAITKNHEFRIYYDLDNDRYWVRTPFNPEIGGFAKSEDEPHMLVYENDLQASGIAIEQVVIDGEPYTAGTIYVRFDPLGASSNHSIYLRQSIYERDFTIEVLPLTGDIRFHDGPYERDAPDDSDFQ